MPFSCHYRNPSRGFYDPVNTKRWLRGYPRYTVKKKNPASTAPEHVRRKREDAQHVAHTAILLSVLTILTGLIVGQVCVVVTSTITALTFPLFSAQSLYGHRCATASVSPL